VSIVVVAFLVVAIALPVAAAQGSQLFGVNYSFSALEGKDADKLDRSGARTVRWTFSWARIERSQGSFDWSAADRVVGDLASRGIRVAPTLYASPRWLEGSAATPPIDSQRARDAWQRFLREAVKRYGPGGTYWTVQYLVSHPGAKPLPINTWQIWNEPNLRSHFAPRPSPARYATLLQLSRPAIAQGDPGAKVIFAGMPGYSNDVDAWDFLKRVYMQGGAGQAFDIAALHPYARNVDQMLGEVKRFRKVMREHGDGGKPLWITEIGWGSAHKTSFGLTKGKHGQARMLRRSFDALKHKRRAWRIKRVLWFNFRDAKGGGQGCSFCSSAGLLKANYEPKPAWSAFRSFTH
jgi:polysaccharide biosynthesis protein PslG